MRDLKLLNIKPEHDQYREVTIHVVLSDARARALVELINGDNPFRPYVWGKAYGSGVLTYPQALERKSHYVRSGL